MDQTDPLLAFIDKMLTEKQFKNLEPEVQQQLRQDLYGRLQDHINAAIIERLSPEQLKEFESKLEAGADAVTMQAFMTQSVSDMDQVVAGALVRFHDLYVASS